MLRKGWLSARNRHLFVTTWLLLAAMFPLYAPWLNPGFAALQPDHTHLYREKPYQPHAHNLQHGKLSGSDLTVTNLPNLQASGSTAVPILIAFLYTIFLTLPTAFFLFRERTLGVTILTFPPAYTPPRLVTH